MKEIWKDIYFIENGIKYDYKGFYQVSNLGNIKSLNYNHTNEEKELKILKRKDGYCYVHLQCNNNRKDFCIHRLVAHMFVKGYFDGAEVDHINCVRDDNRSDNLRWCTTKENMNNPLTKEKRVGENNPMYGKNHKSETKMKISESQKGKKLSEKTKQKMSENHLNVNGENNPMYGKKHKEESKQKMSNANKGENHPQIKKIAQYDKQMNLIKIWSYAKQIEDELGIYSTSVTRCCKFWELNCDKNEWFKTHKNKPIKSSGGFIWKYA